RLAPHTAVVQPLARMTAGPGARSGARRQPDELVDNPRRAAMARHSRLLAVDRAVVDVGDGCRQNALARDHRSGGGVNRGLCPTAAAPGEDPNPRRMVRRLRSGRHLAHLRCHTPDYTNLM